MSSRKNGFTMIELLISISIMTIVFTIGFASYREFSRRQVLSGVAKELKSDLRTLQQLALTGQKPEDVSCVMLDGYIFEISDPDTYRLSANCINGLGSSVEYLTKEVSLLNDSVSISATQNSIYFKVLGQGTDLDSTNIITLTQDNTGKTVSVNVGTAGEIN